jgi:hypothetical protein
MYFISFIYLIFHKFPEEVFVASRNPKTEYIKSICLAEIVQLNIKTKQKGKTYVYTQVYLRSNLLVRASQGYCLWEFPHST